jgi:hypothetical protein
VRLEKNSPPPEKPGQNPGWSTPAPKYVFPKPQSQPPLFQAPMRLRRMDETPPPVAPPPSGAPSAPIYTKPAIPARMSSPNHAPLTAKGVMSAIFAAPGRQSTRRSTIPPLRNTPPPSAAPISEPPPEPLDRRSVPNGAWTRDASVASWPPPPVWQGPDSDAAHGDVWPNDAASEAPTQERYSDAADAAEEGSAPQTLSERLAIFIARANMQARGAARVAQRGVDNLATEIGLVVLRLHGIVVHKTKGRRGALMLAALPLVLVAAIAGVWVAMRPVPKASVTAVVEAVPTEADIARILRSRTGFTVSTEPSGARIVVDGESTGRVTPERVSGFAAGMHSIEIKLDGYYDTNLAAVLEEGSTLVLPPVTLRPLPTSHEEPSRQQ